MSSGDFFAVGRDSFIKACNLGMNPACVFLGLARGTGRDNVTTTWSAQACKERMGARWATAESAIATLEASSLVKVIGGSKARPRRSISQEGDLLWLPNAIVDGVPGASSPLARIRSTQEVMVLRLLVELYGEQNLAENGGIDPSVYYQTYTRESFFEWGAFTIWGFDLEQTYLRSGSTVFSPHITQPGKSKKSAELDTRNLWERLGTLHDLGLLVWIPYLYDGPKGEPMHPLVFDSGVAFEEELYQDCMSAVERCLPEALSEKVYDYNIVAPVYRQISHVTVRGVARLRYRPKTSITGAWWSQSSTLCGEFSRLYHAIAPAHRHSSAA